MSYTPETHLEYARRVGAPRVVECDIDPATRGFVWYCRSHDYGFRATIEGFVETAVPHRCPMSRLEEFRSRLWALWELPIEPIADGIPQWEWDEAMR